MVEPRTRITGRMVFGLVIMGLGILWTLDNLGLVYSGPILRWWPLALVAFGVAKLLGAGTSRHLAAGAIFVIAGGWLLAERFDLVQVSLFELWPLALVLLGLSLLARSVRHQREEGVAGDPSSRFSSFAIWSGIGRKALSKQFRGGEVTAIMGGVEIDMRAAKPVPGGAVVDVFVWWGGVDLFVPEDWKVLNEATVLMGGIEDNSKAPPSDTQDALILRGLVVMGGVEIKN